MLRAGRSARRGSGRSSRRSRSTRGSGACRGSGSTSCSPRSVAPARRPVVIEMDGLEYHAATVAQDLLDRLTDDPVRGGPGLDPSRGETLTGRRPPLNPLAEPGLGAQKTGPFGRPRSPTRFSACSRRRSGQSRPTARSARYGGLLDGETEEAAPLRSVLVRALVATGRPLDQLPRRRPFPKEGRGSSYAPGLRRHIGAGALDLYLACQQISPDGMADTNAGPAASSRAALPEPGEMPAAKVTYTDAWRGLWRLCEPVPGGARVPCRDRRARHLVAAGHADPGGGVGGVPEAVGGSAIPLR